MNECNFSCNKGFEAFLKKRSFCKQGFLKKEKQSAVKQKWELSSFQFSDVAILLGGGWSNICETGLGALSNLSVKKMLYKYKLQE